jgi:fumarate reductase subunit D
MDQTVGAIWPVSWPAFWPLFLAGAAVVAIIIVGGMWAVIGIFLRHLRRDYAIMRTQMDGVHVAINSLAVSLAELRATVSPLINGLNKMHEDIEKLRVDVDSVSGNVARIAKFLGHLAGTPPAFPSDLLPE